MTPTRHLQQERRTLRQITCASQKAASTPPQTLPLESFGPLGQLV